MKPLFITRNHLVDLCHVLNRLHPFLIHTIIYNEGECLLITQDSMGAINVLAKHTTKRNLHSFMVSYVKGLLK